MNEQIQNLINQAKREDAEAHPYGTQDMDRVMEKFAELIVRKCAKVLEIQGSNTGHEQYHYGASLIEEHFGVLE